MQCIPFFGDFKMTNENLIDNSKLICDKIEQINEQSDLIVDPIPTELITNKGKVTKIINNDDQSIFINVKNSTVIINFKEPFYCNFINIRVQNGQSLKGVKVTAKNCIFGKEIRYTSETISSNDYIRYTIRSFITEINITPPETIILSKNINRIGIAGKSATEIIDLEDTIKRSLDEIAWVKDKKEELALEVQNCIGTLNIKQIESLAKLTTIENNIATTEAKLNDKKDALNQLESELSTLKNEREHIAKSIEEASSELRAMEVRNEAINSSRDRVQSELTHLNAEVVDKTNKLKELNENVNLFTEDFAAYISQTKKQEYVYIAILSFPILIVCSIAYQLLSGAVDLTFKFQRENIDLIALFSSRFPYVVTAAAIIAACAKIIQTFSTEIINLHEGRRNLAQISIIARDVSDAEGEKIEMNRDEIYEHRVKLKMDLLKSHISGMMHKYKFKIKENTVPVGDEVGSDSKQDSP